MSDNPREATNPSRRGFLGRAALVATMPAAAAILGPVLVPAAAAAESNADFGTAGGGTDDDIPF